MKETLETVPLAREAARRYGCRYCDSQRLLETYVRLIQEALAQGKRVRIRGLGTFSPRPEWKLRAVRFEPARDLREAARRAPRPPAGAAALADEMAMAGAGAGGGEGALTR